MTTPIKVMYVIPRVAVGGTPRHMLHVLERLDRRRVSPVLCCLKAWPDNPFLARVRELGVEIVDARTPGTFRGFRWMPVVLRLAREMRRRRIDVVHGYLHHANTLAALSGRLARVPVVVVSKRSLDTYEQAHDRAAYRIANALATRVMVNADAVRDHVARAERCPRSKIVVLPNGVDIDDADGAVDARWPWDAITAVVGTVGRLAVKKSQADLIDAIPRVIDHMPCVRFVIVGDGPDRPALEARARALGVDGHVAFLGARPDGARLMRAMDVFVLPSRMEGMSNALLEAMAAARPIVATDVGGNAELVRDGQSGFIVPPAAPDRLADAILTLLKDPERARAMGAAARARVEHEFTVAAMVARLEQLYEALLTEKSRARA